MGFIGQRLLLNKLNNLTLDNMPRSLLLLGEDGCGKHTYSNLIANRLELKLVDITDDISLDAINEIYSKGTPQIYLISINKLTVKEQNIILKLVEEPLKNSYLILIGVNKIGVLPTILNRCHCWTFERYSDEELSSFEIPDPYKIAETPGQLLNLKGIDIDPIVKLADSILDRVGRATISNTLNIANKIALKGEKDKFNFDIFNRVLLLRSTQLVKRESNPRNISLYTIISEYISNCSVPRVDVKNLLDNLLITLWEVAHGFESTQI